MIITNKLPADISRAYAAQAPRVEDRQQQQQAAAVEKQAKDEVSLSAEAHVLQKVKAEVLAASDMRTERVAELKRKIAEGAYEIPYDALVDRLLGKEEGEAGKE